MIGIILTSHGEMAKGMLNSAKLFYGEDIKQIQALSLSITQTPEDYTKELIHTINLVDTGDGVIILADLFGGTPCNKAITCLRKDVDLISGMNLSLLLEILGLRENNELHIDEILQTAKDNMMHVNTLFQEDAL